MVALLKKFIGKFFKSNPSQVARVENTEVLPPQEVESEYKVSRKERLREIREARHKETNRG